MVLKRNRAWLTSLGENHRDWLSLRKITAHSTDAPDA